MGSRVEALDHDDPILAGHLNTGRAADWER